MRKIDKKEQELKMKVIKRFQIGRFNNLKIWEERYKEWNKRTNKYPEKSDKMYVSIELLKKITFYKK